MKNCIRPPYEKLKFLKSGFIIFKFEFSIETPVPGCCFYSIYDFSERQKNNGHQQQENAPLHTVVAPLPVGRDEDEVFVDLELRLEVRPVNG